jgi:hypothetical protein
MRPERVCQHRLPPDQQCPRAMQHENSLLIGALDRDKPHVRPAHRLANCLRIRGVVLSTLDIGLHVSRRHQLYSVPKLCKFAPPIMRRRAGFHPDQARFETRHEREHLGPSETFANNRRAICIDGVNLKYSLGEINADCGNLHGGRPLSMWRAL